MTGHLSPWTSPRRPGRGDEGVAFLVVVIAIGAVMAVLATTLFRAALDNVTTSSRTVEEGQALQAAEAGVDSTYRQIASASTLAHMPCGPITGTLGSAPSRSSYKVSIEYYATSTALSCEASALKTADRVQLASTGADLTQTALVLSAAHVAPSFRAQVFDDAIFVTGDLTWQGADTLFGGKNVYVNGTLSCSGSGTVYGNVTVIGNATLSGACPINGQLEATGNITIGGSAVVGGTVISTTGTITITGNPTVSGSMYAHGTITIKTTNWKAAYLATHTVTITGTRTTVKYTINQTYTWLTPPAKQTFPAVNWTPTGWAAKGYAVVTAGSTCKAAYAAIYSAHTATAKPQAVYTTCQITIPPHSTYCPSWQKYYCPQIPLAHTLAIVSTAGITLKTSGAKPQNIYTTGGKHTLFFIVPSHVWTSTKGTTGAALSCTGGNGAITVRGTVGPTVNTLVYSPCSVKISGASSTQSGELATKTFTADGGMSFGEGAVTVPGSSGGGVTGGNPTVGILYERECSGSVLHCAGA